MGMTINGTSGLVFPDSTTMATGSQAVRAWVNFNGTGTVAIRAAYNVSSITDLGTGYYRANFTNALVDTSYAVATSASPLDNATVQPTKGATLGRTTDVLQTTSVAVITGNINAAVSEDMPLVTITVFR